MESPTFHFFSLKRVENIFLINGISALLGWNAVLTVLDYFSYVFKGYNVYLYFPIPNKIAYVIAAIFFKLISNNYSYQTIVKVGIIGLNFTMLYLLLVSLLFKENLHLGFWLLQVGGFFAGFFNNIYQLSFYAMINYLGRETVSRFTIGTAISALLLLLLRIIVTIMFGSEEGNYIPIVVYFSLSMAFNFFDLYLNIKLFESKQFKEKTSLHSEEDQQEDQIEEEQQGKNYIEKKPYHLILWESLKATFPFPLYIFFTYIVTFLLFPNLTLLKKTSFGTVWSNIMILLMFNIGDFIGKTFGEFRNTFNSKSIIFLAISRLIFLGTITLMLKDFAQSDSFFNSIFFVSLNQLLFGFSNGFVTNGLFILSFERAPNSLKKYAGVLGGLLLEFGIMIGSFLAIPFQRFVHPDT